LIEIIFLGTGNMFPTERRNHPSVLLRYEGDYFLFDCGEGTQKQLRKAKVSPNKINYILLTHWHGDHALGIPGIFQSLSANSKTEKIVLVGPRGSKERVEHLKKAFAWYQKFEIQVIEAKEGVVLESEKWTISAMKVKHGVPTLAYSFQERGKVKINLEYTRKFGLVQHPLLGKLQKGEKIVWKGKEITPEKGTITQKGKKITYVTDTVFFPDLVDFAMGSDVLISEASFMNKEKDMALEKRHMTTGQVATLAKKAGCKKLEIFHVSPRYTDEKGILKEVREIFKDAEMTEDLKKMVIK
jgi:ribonuclease Z